VTRIIWSPLAVDDVEAIRAYVARDSQHSADLLLLAAQEVAVVEVDWQPPAGDATVAVLLARLEDES
jgi:hypothetical protein